MTAAAPATGMRGVLGAREPVLDGVLRRARAAGMPPIHVDDDAGRLLQMLTRLRRPRRAVEVGTLFGYSAIHIARGLPPGGRLTTLEIDPAAARLARQNLEAAGVADRVDVVVGDAVEHLRGLPPASVGLLFIDADKKSYPAYLKHGFPAVEDGGLIIADDAFAAGDFTAEAEPGADDERELRAIRTYTRAAGRSPRLFSAFAGTGQGMMISLKEAS